MNRKKLFLGLIFGTNVCLVLSLIVIAVSKRNGLQTNYSPVGATSLQDVMPIKTISANTDWQQSDVLRQLREFGTLKVFANLIFTAPMRSDWIKKCSKKGIDFLSNKKSLLGKSYATVLITPQQMQQIRGFYFVHDIQIYVEFVASATYRLKIWLDGPQEKVDFTVSLPYGRNGHTLRSRVVKFMGAQEGIRQTDQLVFAQVDTAKNRYAVFSSAMDFSVNLQELLSKHIRVWGKDISLQDYRKQISSWPLTSRFTQTNEHIQFCDYVEEVVKTIDPTDSLQKIWVDITKKLDDDIAYDWKKKAAFFSGKLSYTDIKSMYLTCNQLAVMRVGACPERSALEVALLRRLGIPSRTVTRLFHIYAQVYAPKLGWISTSVNVRQIPLCESMDADLSYFVSWTPHHPVRIKWEGGFLPKELIKKHADI